VCKEDEGVKKMARWRSHGFSALYKLWWMGVDSARGPTVTATNGGDTTATVVRLASLAGDLDGDCGAAFTNAPQFTKKFTNYFYTYY